MATDRLGDLQLFVETSALGSLSAAGRKLGLSPAAASARLSKLRISASTDFGRHLLCDWLDEFTREHPQVRIALTLTDSLSNLIQDDMDLAIRFGAPDNPNLIARRLAPNWRVLCASPDYLATHGTPRTPDDLAQHDFIVLVTNAGPLNEFHFARGEQQWTHTVAMDRAWETNDGALARRWALAGHGIARKTIWDAAADLRDGSLRLLLPEYVVREEGLYVVLHRTRHAVPRVRRLIDFLAERFAQAGEELAAEFPEASLHWS